MTRQKDVPPKLLPKIDGHFFFYNLVFIVKKMFSFEKQKKILIAFYPLTLDWTSPSVAIYLT